MEFLSYLWLPIVLSAVLVWIAAAIAWTALPHHKHDWKRLPDENAFLAAIRPLGIPPGNYGFPYCTHGEAKSEEFQKKWKEGPMGLLCIWPGCGGMGKKMVLSFLIYLVIGTMVAYLADHALEPGAAYLAVFRIVGVAAVLAYTAASLPNAVWFNKPANAVVAELADGIVYGLLTAGTFAWLWPSGSAGV